MESAATYYVQVPACFEEKNDYLLYQAQKGDNVIFQLTYGDIYSNNPQLLSNINPIQENIKPTEISFQPLNTTNYQQRIAQFSITPFERVSIDSLEATYKFARTGAHMFQIQYNQPPNQKCSLPIYILIHPKIIINSLPVGMGSLAIQTILPRGLGKLCEWKEAIQRQIKLGYNAIHFPPIQTYDRDTFSHYMLEDYLKMSDFYFVDNTLSNEERLAACKSVLDSLKTPGENSPLFFIDIVLNHCSRKSTWIIDHKDAYYHTENTPHLEAAYQLDKVLMAISEDFKNKTICKGFAPILSNAAQIEDILREINRRCQEAKLEEYFLLDIESVVKQIKEKYNTFQVAQSIPEFKTIETIIADYEKKGKALLNGTPFPSLAPFCIHQGWKRFGAILDLESTCVYLYAKHSKAKWSAIEVDFIKSLKQLNDYQSNVTYRCHLQKAVENTNSFLLYEKIKMKRTVINTWNPLFNSYFSEVSNGTFGAHNGFIIGAEPSEDFMEESNQRLFRRDLLMWTESVKLRYGKTKQDSPALWKHMKKYVKQLAVVFDGFRLDNAHSTPFGIGRYLANHARKVNSNLAIIAELFTGINLSSYFINWGINCIVRESIYWNNAEAADREIYERQLISTHPLGQLDQMVIKSTKDKKLWFAKNMKKVPPPCIQYDITHDNELPEHIWNNRAILPIIALVSMGTSMLGTTRGIDEMYAKHVDVVIPAEFRYDNNKLTDKELQFLEDTKVVKGTMKIIYKPTNFATDVHFASSYFNWEPKKMVCENNIFTIEFPEKAGEYQFKFVVDGKWMHDPTKPVKVDQNGNVNNYFECYSGYQATIETNNLHVIRLLFNNYHYLCNIGEPSIFLARNNDAVLILRHLEVPLANGSNIVAMITRTCFTKELGSDETVDYTFELPGYIQKVALLSNMYVDKENKPHIFIHKGEKALGYFCNITAAGNKTFVKFFKMPYSLTMLLELTCSKESNEAMKQMEITTLYDTLSTQIQPDLTLMHVNHLLFSSINEEKEKFNSFPEYKNYTPPYAGLCGILMKLNELANKIDVSHGLLDDIRSNKVIDVLNNRIKSIIDVPSLLFISQHLKKIKEQVPVFLKPKYLHRLITLITEVIINQILLKDQSVYEFAYNSSLTRKLILSTSQFLANVKSNSYRNISVSMAAGHPHFATGYMRCWGRDTFISFNGLLLVPKYYKEAHDILVMFAAVMKYGLIANLHDNGVHPRYNSRDATWLFLKALVDYVNADPTHSTIFKESVNMQFPFNGQSALTIEEIAQAILQTHVDGVSLREDRAGKDIDMHMTDKGFNISIKVNTTNGFEYGGNKYNCGTWMDKMGSAKSNIGVPATPRDGAAVEITALIYAVVSQLDEFSKSKAYYCESVKLGEGNSLTFSDWAKLIKANFETNYWIPENSTNKFALIKGIYKDNVRLTAEEEADFHMKPNYLVAMSISPALFNKEHAVKAIKSAITNLLTPTSIGIKTLAPKYKIYKPEYVNTDETDGFSYHSGPEWVWPIGHLLISILKFYGDDNLEVCMKILLPHQLHICNDEWMSLPELTNGSGKLCKDSCNSQAWSVATVLEALYIAASIQDK